MAATHDGKKVKIQEKTAVARRSLFAAHRHIMCSLTATLWFAPSFHGTQQRQRVISKMVRVSTEFAEIDHACGHRGSQQRLSRPMLITRLSRGHEA